MKRLRPIWMLLMSCASGIVAGQPVLSTFWQTPGATIRDSAGKVVREEIKDSRTFTIRVVDHGTSMTYHYLPNTETVTRVEAPDTSEDFLYDAAGVWNGLSVHVNGRVYKLRVSKGIVETDGMAGLTVDHDSLGRDIAVRRGGELIASVAYSPSGVVERFTLGKMTLSVTPTSGGIAETLQGGRNVLATTTAGGAGKRIFPLSLDVVAGRLGLAKEWTSTVKTKRSATGSMITVQGERGVVARLVELGGMRAAFDSNGDPLFYDVRLNYGTLGGDRNADLTAAFRSVLPSRVVIAADGGVAAYVEAPAKGAIRAFWTTGSNATPYAYRIFNPEVASKSSARVDHKSIGLSASEDSSPNVQGRGVLIPGPKMIMQCDQESVCTSGDCGGCSSCYMTMVCDPNSGGGTPVSPPSDPDSGGAGGGTGGSGNNQVTGDTSLRFAVGNAIAEANRKLASAQCNQTLFDTMKKNDGTTLSSVLAQNGSNATDWFNNRDKFYNGTGVRDASGTDVCGGGAASAWTTPGNTDINVCSTFKGWSTGMAAAILIHEELHSLGLSERPRDPNAQYDTGQITQIVVQYCGN